MKSGRGKKQKQVLRRRQRQERTDDNAKDMERFLIYMCQSYETVAEHDLVANRRIIHHLNEEGKLVKLVRENAPFDRAYLTGLIHPDDLELMVDAFSDEKIDAMIAAGGGEEYFEARVRDRDPEEHDHLLDTYSWYSYIVRGIPKDRKHPRNYVVFEKQIQEAKVREEEQKQLLVDALENARSASEAKGQFLSRMSHEIRTPLNAVIGYMEIAKEAGEDPEKVKHCIENSDIAAKHLLHIINDVLDISSIESGKLKIAHEKYDLKELLTGIAKIFGRQAREKRVGLKILIHSLTTEQVVGDSLRLNQILMNLLSNALKFTPEHGLVTFTVTQVDVNDRKVFLTFRVQDTGIGMSEEYKKRLFTPFEQESAVTAQKYGGTGLGLSITFNLVNLMGGSIQVESEIGKGSSFVVSLHMDRYEVEAEAGAAVGREVEAEAGVDAGREAEAEAGVDAGREAEAEAGVEAGREAEAGAGVEAGREAEAGAGTDSGCEEEVFGEPVYRGLTKIPSAAGVRVLLLEPDQEIGGYVKQILKTCGAKCDMVADADMAVRRILGRCSTDYPYRLCLVDVDRLQPARELARETTGAAFASDPGAAPALGAGAASASGTGVTSASAVGSADCSETSDTIYAEMEALGRRKQASAEFVQKLREACGENLPVVVGLINDFSDFEGRPREVGMWALVSKPVFLTDLQFVFDCLFGGKSDTATIPGNSGVTGVDGGGKSAPASAGKAHSAADSLKGRRVLLAEDNPMNMEIAVEILKRAGLVITQVVNGKEAVDQFLSKPAGSFDAILMDVQMPVMDGYQACGAIRTSAHPESRTIPIIAMTANAFAEDVNAALAAGMNGHISKPVNYEKLYGVLGKFCK